MRHEERLAGRRARNDERRSAAQAAFEAALEEFEAQSMASYHTKLAAWEQHKAQLLEEATRVRDEMTDRAMAHHREQMGELQAAYEAVVRKIGDANDKLTADYEAATQQWTVDVRALERQVGRESSLGTRLSIITLTAVGWRGTATTSRTALLSRKRVLLSSSADL